MTATKNADLISISLLTLLAFALRVYQLGASSLWYDELLELDVARNSFWQIGPQLERHAAMPLDYYLLHGWIKWGQQETWVRFPALFFGVLTMPVVFKLATGLFKRRVGYLAALLFACASFAVDYSQEVRPYALLLLLTTLSFWGVWRAHQTGRGKYWVVGILALTVAALAHYFTLFLLLPVGLFAGLQQLFHLNQKKFWRHMAYFGLCVGVVLAVFALNGRLQHLYNVSYGFSSAVSQPEAFKLPPPEKPNRGSGPPQDAGFFIANVLIPLATTEPISLICYSFLALVALLSFILRSPKFPDFRQNREILHSAAARRWAILLLFNWLFWPVLLIYLFLLQRGTFFAVRYILYTLPAFIILVAFGLDILVSPFFHSSTPPFVRFSSLPTFQPSHFRQMLGSALLVAIGSKSEGPKSAVPTRYVPATVDGAVTVSCGCPLVSIVGTAAVTLVPVHDSVDDPFGATDCGLAVSVKPTGDCTDTETVFAILPPLPLQVSVKLAFALSALVV
jgi:4-amino-4-deoxy-L-arabinose transferase-like glycosyltransferase